MDFEEFKSLAISCRCRRCPHCWARSIARYCFEGKDYAAFSREILDGFQGVPIFEHVQVHSILGEIPWYIGNRIRSIFNRGDEPLSPFEEMLWILYNENKHKFVPNPQGTYTFSLKWKTMVERTTSIMVLEGGENSLVFAFLVTKHCDFSLKALSAQAVISQLAGKWELQSLVASRHLPSSLAHYLSSFY